MALSISTSNSVKPMAISSITSPPLPNSNLVSSSSLYHHHHASSPHRQLFYPSTAPSPPESPTYRNSQHQHYSHHYQRHSIPFYNPSYHLSNKDNDKNYYQNGDMDNFLQRTSSVSSLQAPPLSLQERRQRNKAASAKYRAKKNQQHGEMRSHILSLTKENDMLQRQIDHIRGENNRLKATCDRLRGKMLAEKMLKKLLNGKEEEEEDDDTDNDMELTEDYPVLTNNDQHDIQYRKEQHDAILKRFDEDIDFDDEDDEEDEEDENDYRVV